MLIPMQVEVVTNALMALQAFIVGCQETLLRPEVTAEVVLLLGNGAKRNASSFPPPFRVFPPSKAFIFTAFPVCFHLLKHSCSPLFRAFPSPKASIFTACSISSGIVFRLSVHRLSVCFHLLRHSLHRLSVRFHRLKHGRFFRQCSCASRPSTARSAARSPRQPAVGETVMLLTPPVSSLLKHLLNVEGGDSRMTVSPTATGHQPATATAAALLQRALPAHRCVVRDSNSGHQLL